MNTVDSRKKTDKTHSLRHSPEPWYSIGRKIYDQHHNLIATTHLGQNVNSVGEEIGRAVANRIVKCVNTFRPINDPDLQSLSNKIDSLTKENDDLVYKNNPLGKEISNNMDLLSKNEAAIHHLKMELDDMQVIMDKKFKKGVHSC